MITERKRICAWNRSKIGREAMDRIGTYPTFAGVWFTFWRSVAPGSGDFLFERWLDSSCVL